MADPIRDAGADSSNPHGQQQQNTLCHFGIKEISHVFSRRFGFACGMDSGRVKRFGWLVPNAGNTVFSAIWEEFQNGIPAGSGRMMVQRSGNEYAEMISN